MKVLPCPRGLSSKFRLKILLEGYQTGRIDGATLRRFRFKGTENDLNGIQPGYKLSCNFSFFILELLSRRGLRRVAREQH